MPSIRFALQRADSLELPARTNASISGLRVYMARNGLVELSTIIVAIKSMPCPLSLSIGSAARSITGADFCCPESRQNTCRQICITRCRLIAKRQ